MRSIIFLLCFAVALTFDTKEGNAQTSDQKFNNTHQGRAYRITCPTEKIELLIDKKKSILPSGWQVFAPRLLKLNRIEIDRRSTLVNCDYFSDKNDRSQFNWIKWPLANPKEWKCFKSPKVKFQTECVKIRDNRNVSCPQFMNYRVGEHPRKPWSIYSSRIFSDNHKLDASKIVNNALYCRYGKASNKGRVVIQRPLPNSRILSEFNCNNRNSNQLECVHRFIMEQFNTASISNRNQNRENNRPDCWINPQSGEEECEKVADSEKLPGDIRLYNDYCGVDCIEGCEKVYASIIIRDPNAELANVCSN